MWGVCAGVRVYVFTRRQPKVTFHEFCILFWNKVSAGLELTKKARQADQWAPIGLPVSISPVLEEQAYTTKPAFKKKPIFFLNIVHVAVFQGKHSSSWAIFPTLALVLSNCLGSMSALCTSHWLWILLISEAKGPHSPCDHSQTYLRKVQILAAPWTLHTGSEPNWFEKVHSSHRDRVWEPAHSHSVTFLLVPVANNAV